jgi:hypothetical protein
MNEKNEWKGIWVGEDETYVKRTLRKWGGEEEVELSLVRIRRTTSSGNCWKGSWYLLLLHGSFNGLLMFLLLFFFAFERYWFCYVVCCVCFGWDRDGRNSINIDECVCVKNEIEKNWNETVKRWNGGDRWGEVRNVWCSLYICISTPAWQKFMDPRFTGVSFILSYSYYYIIIFKFSNGYFSKKIKYILQI